MAKKFYAVKKGHNPGIYGSWDACKKQVDGFSGASYKSFLTKEEAEQFMGIGIVQTPRKEAEAVAYVDGSYDDSIKAFSYGVVLFYQGKEEHFCEMLNDKELVEMRNVAGEIKAAQIAMEYCVERGISSIDIHHDYEGIAKWCTGEWKANKVGTQAYRAFYQTIKDKLEVHFVKVKGHSGDQYNDLADELAKKALGIL